MKRINKEKNISYFGEEKKSESIRLQGKNNSKATQEIHIFFAPINPDNDTLNKYYDAVNEWNNSHKNMSQMKACHLALVFRDNNGNEVVNRVMQSARYYNCDDTSEVIEESKKDKKWFEDRGLKVIRQKIEATAYGIDGVPLTDKEAKELGKYFECHIKVCRKDKTDTSDISEIEVNELRKLARDFSCHFGIPIPLSFNHNKNKFNTDGEGHQRFLNVRFRNMGLDTIKPKLQTIQNSINEKTSFRHIKNIFEYVWYDTAPEIDQGWIDFTEDELNNITKLFGSI